MSTAHSAPRQSWHPPPRRDDSQAINAQLEFLRLQIDSQKRSIRELESTLSFIDIALESLSNQLESEKRQIEQFEYSVRAGIYVDEYAYSSAIDSFNALVPRYNMTLEQRSQTYEEYEEALAHHNQLVEAHNLLLMTQ